VENSGVISGVMLMSPDSFQPEREYY